MFKTSAHGSSKQRVIWQSIIYENRNFTNFLSMFSILLSGTVIVSAESGMSAFAGEAVTDEVQLQYSLEKLYRIADEIAAMTKEEPGVAAVKISEAKKCVVIFCEDPLESNRIKEPAKDFDEKCGISAVLFSFGDSDEVLPVGDWL